MARPYCPDCGPATVPHWVERVSARVDFVLDEIGAPFEFILRIVRPVFVKMRLGRMAPAFARFVSALGLGRIVEHPDDKINWRARVIWQEAERRGIAMEEFRPFGLSREFFFAKYKGDTITFDGLPRPRSADDRSMSWIDDKGLMIDRFKEANIPIPKGRSCTTIREAEEVFREINDAVIVKPNLGSRSRHTYVHLTDLPSLRYAFFKAKELSPWVVVEEELQGFVFRVTIVGGKLAGVMRREPPCVTGDGKRTVRELAKEENKNPSRRGPIFHELPMDADAEATLKKQELSLDAVPMAGRTVILNDKVSRAYGATTTEITDIHPKNIALFLKIGALVNEPFVGIDIITQNMAVPVSAQKKSGVIECNSLPFIDLHHFPFKGPARNVAGMLWDLVFPGSGVGPITEPTATQPASRAKKRKA